MLLGSDWQRLHPLSPLLRAGRFVVGAVLLGDDLAARLHVDPRWAGLLPLVALVVGAVAGWWAWSSTGYRVTAEEVELRTGMIFRRHRRLPVARLETIDLAKPLFARFLGLTQVRLEAVSEGDSEVRLSYLADTTALDLRDELRAGLKESHATTDGLGGAPVVRKMIARIPTKELLLALVLGRAAWAWPALLGMTLIIVVVIGPGAAAAFGLVAGPPAVFVPVGVGLIESERLYDFELSEGVRGGLDIRRGLLNQMHQVVPIDRIQAIAMIEPLLWRPFGRAKLVVDVAGYRGGSREQREYGSVLLPIAPRRLANDVLNMVLPGLQLDGLTYVPAPLASRWRSPIRWRRYSVACENEYAVTRHGLLRRQTDIVPHSKVQSLRVTQGPWQRALDLATLHLDTAGTRVRVRARHRQMDDAERLAWASRAAALRLERPLSEGSPWPGGTGR